MNLDEIRQRRDAFRDARARVLRAWEPDSDRAADRQAALDAQLGAAIDSAQDVPTLVAEVDRLRHEVFTLTNSEDARVMFVEQERDNALLEVERLRAELAAERRDHGLTAETLKAFAAEHRREWGAC